MSYSKDLNLSYWELREYYRCWDLVVIGGGIVGLSTALSFREQHPLARILVIERGILPSGASTKNAGFACFGTAGELLDDLSHMPEKVVWQTVNMRWEGLRMLKERIGERKMNYEELGGYELFFEAGTFNAVASKLDELNNHMENELGISGCFELVAPSELPFYGVKGVIRNRFEGQIDTGKMMKALQSLCAGADIDILTGVRVSSFQNDPKQVLLQTNAGTFQSLRLVVATNGFARTLLQLPDVEPARAQVLITSPIRNLGVQGAFHFDKGYYYFRNVNDRILFGGGRNLEPQEEKTDVNMLNARIQGALDQLLSERLLPGRRYEIEHRWTGIMGVGSEKQPIIRLTDSRVVAAVRMGGMGIAIGSWVGREAAKIASQIE